MFKIYDLINTRRPLSTRVSSLRVTRPRSYWRRRWWRKKIGETSMSREPKGQGHLPNQRTPKRLNFTMARES